MPKKNKELLVIISYGVGSSAERVRKENKEG